MAVFPRPARPSRLIADARAFLAGENRHKALFAALAIGVTSLIVYAFIIESRSGILPGPQTIYVEDYPADRTDAQIKADQKIDQKRRAAYAAEKQAAFKRLAKQLNIE